MCPNEGASTVVQEIEGRTGKDGMCVDSLCIKSKGCETQHNRTVDGSHQIENGIGGAP